MLKNSETDGQGTLEIGGKTFIFETGEVAKQAGGSALVRLGDTVVLVAATMSKNRREGIDFFPLTVDYRERTYAAGRIPGGFFKREGRPREKEILTSRIIDRSIRPLFPEELRNDIQIQIVVLSTDQTNDTDIPALLGASLALSLSDAPWPGPIGGVRVARIGDRFVLNPTLEEQEEAALNIVVAGKKGAILMIEGAANQVPESLVLEALALAQSTINEICAFQERFTQGKGRKKFLFEKKGMDETLVNQVSPELRRNIKDALNVKEKLAREDSLSLVKNETLEQYKDRTPEELAQIKKLFEDLVYEEVRRMILDQGVRVDGRKLDEIRPLSMQVGVLPRTHGSALFTRGQTQALSTVTLGTPADKQIMDELEGEYKERFLLHYNFPSFSTGETKPERGPGRREIGHGALARKAIKPLLPSEEEFPYTIRVVSDIMESNGSSSMASVCGGSLALYNAGVPLKSACAGISIGLITQGEKYALLTDIMGLEDFQGDMDFKVAGTKEGITAIQLDIKILGIQPKLLPEILEQAKKARLFILDKMLQVLPTPQADLSAYAPRMVVVSIPVDKIGALIGPGGKNIRRIVAETGADVEVEDDGRVFISSTDAEAAAAAKKEVEYLTVEAEVGKVYKGRVTRIMAKLGAFVEIMPGKEGLVHISQLDTRHVDRVEDVMKEGDTVEVKCVEIDGQGRINLSRKALLQPAGSGGDEQYRRPPQRDRPRDSERRPRRF
jgi:polyribonucleotide nucleotidyltransferase